MSLSCFSHAFCKAWKIRRRQSFHSRGLQQLNPRHCVARTSIQLIQCNIAARYLQCLVNTQEKNIKLIYDPFLLSSGQAPGWQPGSFSCGEMPEASWRERTCVVVWACVCDEVQVGHGVSHWWTWATALREERREHVVHWLRHPRGQIPRAYFGQQSETHIYVYDYPRERESTKCLIVILQHDR